MIYKGKKRHSRYRKIEYEGKKSKNPLAFQMYNGKKKWVVNRWRPSSFCDCLLALLLWWWFQIRWKPRGFIHGTDVTNMIPRSGKGLMLPSSLFQKSAPDIIVSMCWYCRNGTVFEIEKRLEKIVPVMKRCRRRQVLNCFGNCKPFFKPRYMNGAATNPISL